MAHSDGTPKFGSGSTPRTPTTPTFEQLLQGGDGSKWSGMNSPSYNREHDMEDHGHDYPRKSVLAKVKDRARRWRQNLGKKKGVDQDNGTPSWGVSLKEDDYGEEDAVYLGAPMYESELSPEDCKENARQHPRANPVISEKHILPNSPRQEDPPHVNSCTSPNKAMAASRSVRNHDNASMMQGLSIGTTSRQGATAGGRADPNHDNASKMQGLIIGAQQGVAAGGRAVRNYDNASKTQGISIGAQQGVVAGGRAIQNHDDSSKMQGLSIGARQGAAAGGRVDPNHDDSSKIQGLGIGARKGVAAGGRAVPNHDDSSTGARQGVAAGGRAAPNQDDSSKIQGLSIGTQKGVAAGGRADPNPDDSSKMQGLSIGAGKGVAAGDQAADPNHDDSSKRQGLSIGARKGVAAGGRADTNPDDSSKMQGLVIGARKGVDAGGLADPNHDDSLKRQGLSIGARQGTDVGGREDLSAPRQNPASPRVNTWDKGISVREYLSQKLEPGEDDRALSQVITDALSPRKARSSGNDPNNNVGIVEKVKDAVSSFLHVGEKESLSSSNAYPIAGRCPITNTRPEIMEEENRGRTLQAN